MKPYPLRRSYETIVFKRFMFWLLVFMSCACVLVLFWFLSQLGPKNVNDSHLHPVLEIPAEIEVLLKQSIEVEAQFEKALTRGSAEVQDLALLKRALDLQSQYVEALSEYDAEASQRLNRLNKRYQDLSANQLKVMSVALENEARALINDEAYGAARDKYQEAVEMQKTINENFPLSTAYDVGRVTYLRRQVRTLIAQPLLQESLDLEELADELIDKNDWEAAAASLKQAIAIQQRLNYEYRDTNQASVSRLERLNLNLIGIDSGQKYLEIQQISDLGDTLFAEGKKLEAANLYQKVAHLQKQLNDSYPDSQHASSERVLEFQKKKETAQSFELGMKIKKNYDLLVHTLAERHVSGVAALIVALSRDLKQMQETFPRSSLNDKELQVQLSYLNLVQNDLGHIQDRVYDALLSVSGTPGLLMFSTEVPQDLYTLIMGTNPSRNVRDTNPVDSVSWIEAKRFCERLSWILGKKVRLPTESEFRQALGPLRYVVLEDHVWSVLDAEGLVQPVGQKAPFASGLYDLLGNVSEWLESMNRFESEDVQHIGGDAQNSLEQIFTVPVSNAPRGERNRLIGFRFVVLD